MTEYVYCLSNPDYIENLYKIGFTNNPLRRAEELYSTGVPSNFVIEFIIKTTDGKLLEKIIHNKLKNYRNNTHREFFKIPMTTLKDILENELNLINFVDINGCVSGMKELIDKLPAKDSTTHYECECGSKVLMSHKARHLQSPIHFNFINQVPAKPKAETEIHCGCGKTFSKKNKTHHNKTKCHLDWLATISSVLK